MDVMEVVKKLVVLVMIMVTLQLPQELVLRQFHIVKYMQMTINIKINL